MSLRDIAREVKRFQAGSEAISPVVHQQPPKPAPTLIAPKKTVPLSTHVRPKMSDYRGTSINRIAQQIGAMQKYAPESTAGFCWEKCACRKEQGSVHLCTKFLSKCAMEKCPKKYIEAKP